MKKCNFIAMLGVVSLLSIPTISTTQASDMNSALPNYAEGVKALDEQLYSGKDAIKVDEGDMAVFTKASEELAKQMPHAGLQVGEKAPDFSLKNPKGKVVKLSTMLKKGPIVLIFYRGAWCPYCNLQMHQLTTSLPEYKKYGASIIAITPQTPDKSEAQFKKDGYPFEVLSDLDYSVITSYKLLWKVSPELDAAYKHAFGLDIASYNGKDRLGLPIPGTLVIDSSGVIRSAYADTDYKKRMEPAAILATLKQIQGK